MKELSLLFFVITAFWSCSGGGASAPVMDASGYQLEEIPGLSAKIATKYDPSGVLIEEGLLINGVKTGTWITYHPETRFPATVTSYEGGMNNGPYMEFNERGQLSLRATYRNNLLHGPWGKYTFGRPEEEANYKDGQLHGIYRIYFKRNGKLQSETEYKDGKQDGIYRFYNEAGEVTLEYQFKNGEKVSGGIVNPEKPNEPQ